MNRRLRCRDTHTHTTKWRQRKKTATFKSRREASDETHSANLLISWAVTICVCCLTPRVWDAWLWQPQQTNTTPSSHQLTGHFPCPSLSSSTGASQVVLVVKKRNPPANARDVRDSVLIPGSGRPLRDGNGNPLQYSCLENSMGRGAWRATVHRVTKSWTRSDLVGF